MRGELRAFELSCFRGCLGGCIFLLHGQWGKEKVEERKRLFMGTGEDCKLDGDYKMGSF